MNSIISIKNLKKQFKRKINKGFWKDLFKPEFALVNAVNDISFHINPGEAVAFLGPNGAGKTTTVKMLTGLVYPTTGEVSVLGFKPSDRSPLFLKQIGLVMGNKQGLNWDLTAKQSFDLLSQIYEIPKVEYTTRLEKLTKLMQVETLLQTQIRRLSLGERMKMELIGAILHNPKILILDEPTIGLDVIAKQTLRKFLREIQAEMGVTLLLTSHDMDDIETVCDRVVIINKGQKIYDDSLSKLTSTYSQHKFVKISFNSAVPNLNLETKGVEIVETKLQSALYKIDKRNLPEFLAQIAAFDVDDIDIQGVPLETIIQELFMQSK